MYIILKWSELRGSRSSDHMTIVYMCAEQRVVSRDRKKRVHDQRNRNRWYILKKKIISLNFASFCETVSSDVNVDQYYNRKQSSQLKNRHKICIGQK